MNTETCHVYFVALLHLPAVLCSSDPIALIALRSNIQIGRIPFPTNSHASSLPLSQTPMKGTRCVALLYESNSPMLNENRSKVG